MKYEYKTLAVPQYLGCKSGLNMGETLADYVQTKINDKTAQGWEFYRADNYTVEELPGCLGSLFGKQGKIGVYNVLVFRKNVNEEE